MSEIPKHTLEVGDLIAHYDNSIHPGDFIFHPDVGLVLLVNDCSVKISWTSFEDAADRRVIDTPMLDVEDCLGDGTWYLLSRERRDAIDEAINEKR